MTAAIAAGATLLKNSASEWMEGRREAGGGSGEGQMEGGEGRELKKCN